MAAPWYSPSGAPGTQSSLSSSVIRAEFAAIETALDQLPAFNAGEIVRVNAGGTALETLASIAVAQGGTGATTLTDGGVLLGSGTGAVTAMAVLADSEMIVGDGTTDPVAESGATLRTSIGVGTTDAVAFSSLTLTTDLAVAEGGTGVSTLTDGGVLLGSGTGAITAMAVLTDGQMIVGDGTTDPVAESGATLRTSIGVGTTDAVAFSSLTLTTDLAVAEGGTGSSTASGARTNLGLVIGTDVQTQDANLDQIAALAPTDSNFIVGNGSAWVLETASTARTSLGLGSLATLSTINNGNWSGTDLTVSNGGTGASTLTNGGVLLGSGTGAITAMAVLADGAMIVGDGSVDPVAESGTTLRTSIGLGTGNTATFAALVVPGHLITTVTGNTSNTRLGQTAGDAITTGGINNTAIGNGALSAVTTTDNNTAIGNDALKVTTGTGNTAMGSFSLDAVTTASDNTGLGRGALGANQTGASCTGVGSGVLALCTGERNTAVGTFTADDITSGSSNTIMGYQNNAGSSSATNRIVIGVSISGTANDQCSIGRASNIVSNDFGTDAVWSRISDRRKKQDVHNSKLGLGFINSLRTVTYRWKPASELPSEWDVPIDTDIDTETVMTGLIAQEVKEALDKANVGVRFPGWSETPTGEQRISGEAFVFPLIRAVNELTARLEKLEQREAA